jgi:hypothetical protein
MNFRVNIGNVESTTSFGEIIHNTNGIQIESDFQQVSTYASSAGMLFCLGVVKNKDKTKSVDVLFDELKFISLPR